MPGVFTADKYFSFLWIKGKFGKLKIEKHIFILKSKHVNTQVF